MLIVNCVTTYLQGSIDPGGYRHGNVLYLISGREDCCPR